MFTFEEIERYVMTVACIGFQDWWQRYARRAKAFFRGEPRQLEYMYGHLWSDDLGEFLVDSYAYMTDEAKEVVGPFVSIKNSPSTYSSDLGRAFKRKYPTFVDFLKAYKSNPFVVEEAE